MHKISSDRYPYFFQARKRLQSKNVKIALAVVGILSLLTGLWLVAIPVAVVIYFWMKASEGALHASAENFADEVWEDGDALLVQLRGHRLRVPLNQVISVKLDEWRNPRQIHLELSDDFEGTESPLQGRRITFFPHWSLSTGIDAQRQIVKRLTRFQERI